MSTITVHINVGNIIAEEGYDLYASGKRLAEKVKAALTEAYPEAQCEVVLHRATGVTLPIDADDVDSEEVAQIVDRVWAQFDWLVPIEDEEDEVDEDEDEEVDEVDEDEEGEMNEVTRYEIDDQIYIIISDGEDYIVDAEWSDGPAIFDHLPDEKEIAVLHNAYLQAVEEQEHLDRIENEAARRAEQEYLAVAAAEQEARLQEEVRLDDLYPLNHFSHLAKPATLRRAALEGRLVAEKIGRDWLTSEREVRRFLARRRRSKSR